MRGRLDAVKGFLDSMDAADKQQAALGVEVGAVAVAYADELLDHFGLWGGAAAPPPTNLAQARLVVGNTLAFVRGQIEARRMAVAAVGSLHLLRNAPRGRATRNRDI
jgi:hypothetical protein